MLYDLKRIFEIWSIMYPTVNWWDLCEPDSDANSEIGDAIQKHPGPRDGAPDGVPSPHKTENLGEPRPPNIKKFWIRSSWMHCEGIIQNQPYLKN